MNQLIRLLLLSLAASSAVAVPAAERADAESDLTHTKAKFHEYIDRIDENSLQHALQLFDKYRHGISHSQNDVSAEQSSSLAVRMHLAKRDGNSSSAVSEPTTTAAPTTTQAPPTESSTSQNDPTTTGSSGSSTTTDPSPTVTTTSVPTSSSTTSSESTTKPSTTSNPPSTSSERTSTSSSSSSTTSAPTTMKTSTTDAPDTTREPITSTYKSTTTLPNGEQSTVTQITVVHPTQTSVAGTTTGPAPGLQTDSAAGTTASFTRELWLMVGGAAMVAMAL